jgi:hypothetical protein
MLSQIVYDFEAAHQNGDTPRLQDFVPDDAPDRAAVAAELVRIDLEYRTKRGLPISADQYLTPFPELAHDKELLRELIEAESRAPQAGSERRAPETYDWRQPGSATPAWADAGASAARAPEAIPSLADLLDALRQNQLLGPGRLEELAKDLPAPPQEPQALADDLVRRGWLTPFQVDQLFQGRGPQLVVGPYVLLERLGEGGMGTVYKARHRPMERIVALKIMRAERQLRAISDSKTRGRNGNRRPTPGSGTGVSRESCSPPSYQVLKPRLSQGIRPRPGPQGRAS